MAMVTHQSEMEAILSVENIISRLLSTSEEKKIDGASSFNMMKEKDPVTLALNLLELVGSVSNSHDIVFREMCADFLYPLLTDHRCHIWNNRLSVSTQSTIKSILLIRINLEEYSKFIMKKLCDTVSNLRNAMFPPSNNWPELLPFLQQCVISNSNRLEESFFLIFSNLTKDICETLVFDLVILHSLFLKTLNDGSLDLRVRVVALKAAINFIQSLSSLNEMKRVQGLLPAMMMTLTDTLSIDVAAQGVLDFFIELAKNEPRFFRIQLVDVVNTMLEIAEATNLADWTRHLAREFVLSLVEAREKAPGMMKKLPLFTNNFFALLLNLLLDIKDEPSWHIVENSFHEAGETANYIFGLDSLKRLSNALGGKAVAHIAIEQFSSYLVSPEWKKRHAALVALAFIAKGCSKVMIKNLEQVVSMVVPSFQDPHPRVRWAAIKSIFELSIVFSPHLQEQYHNQVVPALAAALDDCPYPRVQALAAQALYNFCISRNPETLLPYLDGILNKLLLLIQNVNQMVQQEAINTLGAVAFLSKDHFQKYYDFVMPCLKTILVNANDESNHMLRSRALDCIAVVGMAVGREKFIDDAMQVMEVLKLSQESQLKEFATIFYILRAWQRICECMGKDFLPHMSTVMPLLVKCVQLESDNKIDKLDNR